MKWKGYSITDQGRREMNQDSFLVDNDRGLFAVADGVGGGVRGEVASLMAVTGLGAHPGDPSKLSDTFQTLQAAVLQEALDSVGEALMGTTLTALYLNENRAELCHVGDSRCYLFSDGLLRQLTEDHETFDETIQSPVLSSYLGIPSDIYPLRIQEEVFPISAGQKFLICSDGLYKQVSEARMVAVLQAQAQHPEALLKTLASEAAAEEYSDNVTIVYIEIE